MLERYLNTILNQEEGKMRGKLTEAHIEQIKNMRADGKKGPEIIEYFKITYRIHLDASEVSRAEHSKEKSQGVASAENPRRRKAQRKYTTRKKGIVPVTESPDEFVNHIRSAFEIYKKGFLLKVGEVIS